MESKTTKRDTQNKVESIKGMAHLQSNEDNRIAFYKGDNLLNKRTEIFGTRRHRNKYKLKDCDSKDWRQISTS